MNKDTIRKVENTLKRFAEVTGKTVEDGIREISSSTARSLAISMQPYGMNASIGKKFESSIARQVDTAWFGTNLGAYPQTSDMRQAHNNARVNGVVPRRLFRKEKGKPWLDLISQKECKDYKEKQMAKAGRAKAAWVRCGNEIYSKRKMSGVPKWISRHVDTAYGSTEESGTGLKYKATMINHTPYLTDRMQDDRTVAKALADSLKNGLKRIQKIIDKEIEKANK